MRTKGWVALLIVASLTAGCSDRKTLVAYRFDPGIQHRYQWTINATRYLESPTEQTTTTVHMQIEVQEQIQESPKRPRSMVKLRLSPVLVQEDAVSLALPPPSSIEFEVGPRGEVTGLASPGGPPASGIQSELSTLASEIRPPLARFPVSIGQSWNAPLNVGGETSKIQLNGTGRLLAFDLKDRRRLAVIETVRKGSISATQSLEGSTVLLKGATRSSGTSGIDLDRGALVFSNQRSESDFDLVSGASVSGKLTVRLSSRLKLRS